MDVVPRRLNPLSNPGGEGNPKQRPRSKRHKQRMVVKNRCILSGIDFCVQNSVLC